MLPSIVVLGPVLAERELGGAGSWALITAVFGCGAVVGNVIALRWRPRRPMLVAGAGMALTSTQAAIIGSGLPVGVIAGLEGIAGPTAEAVGLQPTMLAMSAIGVCAAVVVMATPSVRSLRRPAAPVAAGTS